MRSLTLLVFVAVACSCLTAACSSEGGGDGQFPPREEVAYQIAEAECNRSIGCGTVPESYFDACVEMKVAEFCAQADCNAPSVATYNEVQDNVTCIQQLPCAATGCGLSF